MKTTEEFYWDIQNFSELNRDSAQEELLLSETFLFQGGKCQMELERGYDAAGVWTSFMYVNTKYLYSYFFL